MIESHILQPSNAQCHPHLLYLHRLSGVHYAAIYESSSSYELRPIHGQSRHVTLKELTNTEVWQLLQ